MEILILGSGVVGRSTGLGFIGKGHKVTFVDISEEVVQRLRAEGHRAYLPEELGQLQTDAIMVTISTPAAEDGSVKLSYIMDGMRTVGELLKHQKEWTVVVIRSTVPPTTTEKVLIPLIEASSGLAAGMDFGVCMNPEFLRAASAAEDFAHPWATVIGELDRRSGDALERLYRSFGGKLFRMSLTEAELVKYVNNLRNALLISFNNEMWSLARSMGMENPNDVLAVVTETAESAWNPKYGSKGGHPYGGTCLPKDTIGLLRFAEKLGYEMPLLAAVIAVNEQMDTLAEAGEIPAAQIAGHNWVPSPALTAQYGELTMGDSLLAVDPLGSGD